MNAKTLFIGANGEEVVDSATTEKQIAEVEALKHGSATIQCDVNDALESAENLDDFKARVSNAMNDLMGEAQEIKDTLGKETVHVVIHLFEGILEKVVVHRSQDKAREDYEKRIIEAYGSLVDEQHGKDEILMEEAEVVE